MYCSSRAWAGMSHAAVIQAVCQQRLRLHFPPGAIDVYVALAAACMSYDAGQRPSMEDVVEVLAPVAQMAAEHERGSDFQVRV